MIVWGTRLVNVPLALLIMSTINYIVDWLEREKSVVWYCFGSMWLRVHISCDMQYFCTYSCKGKIIYVFTKTITAFCIISLADNLVFTPVSGVCKVQNDEARNPTFLMIKHYCYKYFPQKRDKLRNKWHILLHFRQQFL